MNDGIIIAKEMRDLLRDLIQHLRTVAMDVESQLDEIEFGVIGHEARTRKDI